MPVEAIIEKPLGSHKNSNVFNHRNTISEMSTIQSKRAYSNRGSVTRKAMRPLKTLDSDT